MHRSPLEEDIASLRRMHHKSPWAQGLLTGRRPSMGWQRGTHEGPDENEDQEHSE